MQGLAVETSASALRTSDSGIELSAPFLSLGTRFIILLHLDVLKYTGIRGVTVGVAHSGVLQMKTGIGSGEDVGNTLFGKIGYRSPDSAAIELAYSLYLPEKQ